MTITSIARSAASNPATQTYFTADGVAGPRSASTEPQEVPRVPPSEPEIDLPQRPGPEIDPSPRPEPEIPQPIHPEIPPGPSGPEIEPNPGTPEIEPPEHV